MTYKRIIVLVFALAVLSAPSAVSAASMANLQAQVQSLMALVTSLQQQVAARYGTYGTTYTGYTNNTPIITIPTSTARPWWCSSYTDVSFGSYNNRVLELHRAMGLSVLGVNPTGYYGTLTYNAWNRWCGGTVVQPPIVGGDRDIHGCIGSAGYSWCASKNSCIRSWEESCPITVHNDPASNPSCQSWYDGCNNCSRSYQGGPATCTERACIWHDSAQVRCTGYFGTSGSYNQPPTITSFSGPTTLNINQTGTWSLYASDPENGQLTYSVSWGDEYNRQYGLGAIAPQSQTFTQSTSFTHQYSQAGTYTVSITVRDSAGQEARTTSTVRIDTTNTVCTLEYSPVCGQPQFYCPSGAYCSQVMPAQKTYGNICQLNADNATLVHYGACSSTPYYY